jgi:hypothetical protein
VLNYQASELLYGRALCIYNIVAESNPTDDEALYVSHYRGLTQRRLQKVSQERLRPTSATPSIASHQTTPTTACPQGTGRATQI